MLLAFQAAMWGDHLTQGVGSHGSPCPGLCAFGLSGRIFFSPFKPKGYMFWAFQAFYLSLVAQCPLFTNERPERAASLSPGQATAGSDTLGV